MPCNGAPPPRYNWHTWINADYRKNVMTSKYFIILLECYRFSLFIYVHPVLYLKYRVHCVAPYSRLLNTIIARSKPTLTMNPAANLEIIPKLMQSYVAGFQLNSIYNSIYFMAFREVYNKSNGIIITKSAETSTTNGLNFPIKS